MGKNKGFNLLEVMIAVAVLGIVIAFGAPSLSRAIEKRDTVSAAEAIYGEIQLARSESVARSQPVFMNIVAGADWAIGFGADQDCDPSDNDPACTLPDVDNDNPITHLLTSADRDNVSISASTSQLTFTPQRGMVTAATIDVTSQGGVGYVITITVGMLGQVSLCSSTADPARHVSSYRPCS